ncbi:MAG: DUF1573 domain-containing protein [Bacteroidetes bacterium]|nr:DUF1573 domain-containing protein [Bacteroidota bacterium]
MRIIPLFFISLILISSSCNNSNPDTEINPDLINNPATASGKNNNKQAVLTFRTETHDFERVIEGAKVSYAFKFTNTGTGDLIINNCVPSCGCTVPEFPKQPIKPGESEFIKIIFDSKGREGIFEKNISVYSNTIPNVRQLYIKGKVIK